MQSETTNIKWFAQGNSLSRPGLKPTTQHTLNKGQRLWGHGKSVNSLEQQLRKGSSSSWAELGGGGEGSVLRQNPLPHFGKNSEQDGADEWLCPTSAKKCILGCKQQQQWRRWAIKVVEEDPRSKTVPRL